MYVKLIDNSQAFYQWDTGQVLTVSSDVDRIDFQFRGSRDMVWGVFSQPNKGEGNRYVDVPDVTLQQSGVLDLLVMANKDGIRTMERMEIPVIERPMPPGYIMTERGTIVTYDDLDGIIGKFDLLRRSGDTMMGDLDMDGYRIANLPDAESDGDAISKHYADNRLLSLDGGQMRGRITGLQEPASDTEPATKAYVDSAATDAADAAKAEAKEYTDDKFYHTQATLPASDWREIADGWWGLTEPNRLSVPGILESDTVFIDLAPEWGHSDAREDIRDAFGLIDSFFPKDGGFDVYATEKPEVDIPIVITAIRG